MSLNPRQRAFVLEYCKDGNGTQAAIRAGYSSRSAHDTAHELLKNPEVADAVATRLARRAALADTKASDVLKRLDALATVDPRDAFAEDGKTLLPIGEMPEDVRQAIASFEVEEMFGPTLDDGGRAKVGHITKIKWLDKGKAHELLGKFHKLFTDKVEHEHSVTINVVDPYASADKPSSAPTDGGARTGSVSSSAPAALEPVKPSDAPGGESSSSPTGREVPLPQFKVKP